MPHYTHPHTHACDASDVQGWRRCSFAKLQQGTSGDSDMDLERDKAGFRATATQILAFGVGEEVSWGFRRTSMAGRAWRVVGLARPF